MRALPQLLRSIFGQVMAAMLLGIVLGVVAPGIAVELKLIADIFIRLIQMVIAPLVLCTVAVGIARAGGGRQAGRIGVKAIVYFEVVTTIAMAMGLLAANWMKPGVGVNADARALDNASAANLVAKAVENRNWTDIILSLTPNNLFAALSSGDILPVLTFSVLFGIALGAAGERTRPLVDLIDTAGHALLRLVQLIMHLAPLAAFAAMSFTIGKFGADILAQMGWLIVCLYSTAIAFVLLVLWPIAHRLAGVSLWRVLKHFREEFATTLGTASSEAVMPRLIEKLQALGCGKPVVGLVLPAGYSFNLDGSSIYMTIAPLFIAQALNIDFGWQEQLAMVGLLLITSKGIAGVAGASLVVIATTLSATQSIPVAGIALILGVDRIQNEIRAVVNLLGNIIATLVIARSERDFDVTAAGNILLAPRARSSRLS